MKNYLKIIICITVFLFAGSIADTLFANDVATGVLSFAFALPPGFINLKHPCGSENMGGYKNRLLFIPACSVSAVPELPPITELSETEDLVTAAGAFVFKDEGDKPIVIYATDKTVQLNSENQGETDGQSFRQNGEFFHPGPKVEAAAFARVVNNTPGYLVLEDTSGTQFLVGSKGLPCTIKPGYTGGAARTDRRGFSYVFEADSFCPFIVLGTPIDIDELENPAVIP